MTTVVQMADKRPSAIVVPAFSGEAERFVLRALRLFRRSLAQANGDAGQALGKHLRERIPAVAVDRLLADLTALLLEIHFVEDQLHGVGRTTAKWSSKQEFFLLALVEASQRNDKARATESAMAMLDTFQVRGVLQAATGFAQRLTEFGLRLMPIGDAAFSYFADYQPIEEPRLASALSAMASEGRPLRLVSFGYTRGK